MKLARCWRCYVMCWRCYVISVGCAFAVAARARHDTSLMMTWRW